MDDSSSSTSPNTVQHHMETVEFGRLEELFYRFPEEFVDVLIPNWRENYVFIVSIIRCHLKKCLPNQLVLKGLPPDLDKEMDSSIR